MSWISFCVEALERILWISAERDSRQEMQTVEGPRKTRQRVVISRPVNLTQTKHVYVDDNGIQSMRWRCIVPTDSTLGRTLLQGMILDTRRTMKEGCQYSCHQAAQLAS